MPQARRPYRSTLREDQARATRRAVVSAARDLFVELGWSRTTIDAVAARAGVSRKTVFTSVGGKAALLKLALDWALVGDDEPVPMSERQVIAEMEQLTDPRALVARWAQFVAELEERAAPLADVLVVAADADPEAAEVHAVSERNRLGGAEFIVARLTATDGLRPGLTTERAVAAALVLMDPAVHRTLVREHRWTSTEYADWIERAAVAELLEADHAERYCEAAAQDVRVAQPGRRGLSTLGCPRPMSAAITNDRTAGRAGRPGIGTRRAPDSLNRPVGKDMVDDSATVACSHKANRTSGRPAVFRVRHAGPVVVLVPRQIRMAGMTGGVPYYGGRFTPAQAHAAAHPPHPPHPPASTPAAHAPVRPGRTRSRRCSDLLDTGVLTQEEFDELQARVEQ